MTDQHIDAPATQAGDVPLFPGGPTMAEFWDEQHAQQGATEFMVGDDQGVGLGGDFGFGPADDGVDDDIAAVMSSLDGLDGLDDREPAEEAEQQPAAGEADAPDTAEQPSTTVHGVPGADGPVTFTGDDALPGFANLHFSELTDMAMRAQDATEGAPASTGPTEEEIAAAKELLAAAEERGEGVQELGHAATYLDAVQKAIGLQLKRTRARAEEIYAAAQLVHGTKSVGVTLDDGGPAVATVHIQEPQPEVIWDEKAVLAFARRHAPHQLREVVSETALSLPDVQAYIAQMHPQYVRTEVFPVYRTLLLDQLTDDGRVPDPDTAELVQVAKIRPPVRTGQFRLAYTKAKGHGPGKDRITRMFRQGLLGDVLALGAAPDDETALEDAELQAG